MEIDITDFVLSCDPGLFSASVAEFGPSAGRITWNYAIDEARLSPLLNTQEALEAMQQWAQESGGWEKSEIAAWNAEDLNALFIQLISGDMREMGLDECDPDEFDWAAYAERSDGGGNIYRGDVEGSESFGAWFYYLGS